MYRNFLYAVIAFLIGFAFLCVGVLAENTTAFLIGGVICVATFVIYYFSASSAAKRAVETPQPESEAPPKPTTRRIIDSILAENVVKLFVTDCLIVAASHENQLMNYQMEKHGWSEQQWLEYYDVFTAHLNHIGVVDENAVTELLDCIHNLVGIFDNPVARRQISNDMADEARKIARDVLHKYGRQTWSDHPNKETEYRITEKGKEIIRELREKHPYAWSKCAG